MYITSQGIIDGVIQDQYGKRGTDFDDFGRSTCSLPFTIREAPEQTACFAFVLEDKDAIPVCGYSWIHWVGANLKTLEVPENASHHLPGFVQGTTSWSGKIAGRDRLAVSSYGGMSPPDKPHCYELHVFALDCELPLEEGFYTNELYWSMEGHVLASATLKGIYYN